MISLVFGLTSCAGVQDSDGEATRHGAFVWAKRGWTANGSVDALLQHAKGMGLSELYVSLSIHADAGALDDLGRLSSAAIAEGIDIAWVMGDPSWATEQGARARDLALAQLAALRERSVPPMQRVLFDVEPWVGGIWEKTGPGPYLESMKELTESARTLGFSPWLVLPFWFDHREAPDGSPLHEAAIALADGIALMAYRNDPNEALDLAWNELRVADDTSTGFLLALETRCIDPPHISYCGQGAEKLAKDVQLLTNALRQFGAFDGIAIHDLDGMRDLGPPP